ncbi:MAG: GDP-L-fucose synthase [Proteobacteria bacterium]|nr:GDP-L-fucose synthase [Pseudomonadota bacterium]
MDKKSKIYVAGHRGMVGSAIARRLQAESYTNLVTKTRQELNLLDAKAVESFFQQEKPEYIFLAAAKVGGINANDRYPADFIYENLVVQSHIIHQSYLNGVKKLLFLGSSCIYPKLCPQPIKEEYLLSGHLEPTNEPYAVAKIAGLKMCQSYNRQYGTNFICAMPTNLYGINDNYHPEDSHAMAALIRRFHETKLARADKITIWGTGSPRREFLYVDDLAEACLFLMNHYDDSDIVNVGCGEDIAIKELANTIKEVVVDHPVELVFDTSMPDGTPRKVLDVSRINDLGWQASIPLKEGIKKAYDWYVTTL